VVVLATDGVDAPDRSERSLLRRLGRVGGAALERVDGPARDADQRPIQLLAHELRNPLQVATLSLEVAREDGDEEAFERLEAALQTMETVVDTAIAMAMGRVGEREDTDVHELAVSVWRTVRRTPAELTIVEPVTVEGDPALIERLLSNLLANAVEHGGPEVSVRVGSLEDGRGFYVEDDGPGIPPAERESVFDWGHTTHVDGLGIGLGLVEQIVEAHGWEIAVTDGSEGGARFVVRTDPTQGEELSELFDGRGAGFEFPGEPRAE